MKEASELLAPVLVRLLGGRGSVEGLARLTGGANMESWSFDVDGHGYVLRRAPSADMMKGRALTHELEAAVVRTARAHGVLAPEVVAVLTPADAVGTGYVMRRIEGDTRPDRILEAPPSSLIGDLARELARIHTVPESAIPAGLPISVAESQVGELRERFLRHGGDRPIMALALAWLSAHLPGDPPPVLLHGDFRMGNVMVGAQGLTGVLDWELAHLGDRHQDLAYGCINSWRFGQIDRPAYGVGALAAFLEAYEKESRFVVDPARVRFWLVYSTLWWGLTCLEMGEIWRSGRDRSLERAVIGRRASETEVDLLMLLDADAPDSERRRVPLPASAAPAGHGEPSSGELLQALAGWITGELKPKLAGRDRFLANVALNALGMLGRATPFTFDKALSDDLLAGRVTLATPGLLSRLRSEALAKLAVDQPKYSALSRARELWGDKS